MSMPNIFSDLTIGQIIGSGIGILAVLSLFIEITPPIKWNPISDIVVWIGKKANKELLDGFKEFEKKLDVMEASIEEIRSTTNEQNAITCRVRILHFGDEILHGVKHSKESFDQVLSDIDGYEQYCNEHPDFKNNRTVLTTDKIKETYTECINKSNFL